MRIPNKFNGYSKDGIRLYNDPVTMAVVGGMAGAALSPKDPLKGALLGAVGGFGGGAMLGAGGIGAAGSTAAGTAGGAASAGIAAQPALSYAGAQTAAGAAAAPSGFLANTMAGMGKDFSAVTQFAKENPMLAKSGMDAAQGLLSPEQPQMPPSAGLMRGQIAPQQMAPYSMARPQISLI